MPWLSLWKNRQHLRLRMEYIWQTLNLGFPLLVFGAMFCFAWYQYLFMPPQPVRPGGELPGELDPTTTVLLFTGMALFAIPYFTWRIVEIWLHSYVLSIRGEERAFFSSDFDTSQTVHIGPLTNVSGKALVLRLRWSPQLKNMPRVKSFALQTVSGKEREATFTVMLTHCEAGNEVELSRHNLVQKITTPSSKERPPEYDKWRKIIFHIPDSSTDDSLKISVKMNPRPQTGVDTTERLWLELSPGLGLRDVKNNDFSYASNIETAEMHVV